jgi:hypothetical protein
VQWHDVFSLLQAVGANVEIHEARVTLTIGSETESFDRPKAHDLDEQQLIDLRRMLTGTGVTAAPSNSSSRKSQKAADLAQ